MYLYQLLKLLDRQLFCLEIVYATQKSVFFTLFPLQKFTITLCECYWNFRPSSLKIQSSFLILPIFTHVLDRYT